MTDNFFIHDNNLKVMAASNHVSTDKINTTDIHIRNYSSFEKLLPTSKSQHYRFCKLNYSYNGVKIIFFEIYWFIGRDAIQFGIN